MTRLHAIGAASQPRTYHVQRLRTPASQTDAAKETSSTTIQIVRRDLERQERKRPERDRKEGRVEVVVRPFDRRRLLVQRLAGIQARAGVVVGVDVGGRIGRQCRTKM